MPHMLPDVVPLISDLLLAYLKGANGRGGNGRNDAKAEKAEKRASPRTDAHGPPSRKTDGAGGPSDLAAPPLSSAAQAARSVRCPVGSSMSMARAAPRRATPQAR